MGITYVQKNALISKMSSHENIIIASPCWNKKHSFKGNIKSYLLIGYCVINQS
jgi:hypothetical protein